MVRLIILALLALLSMPAAAQQIVRANKGWFNNALQVGAIEVTAINTAVNGTTGAAHNSFPTTKAIFDYVQASAVLAGSSAGGDLVGAYPNPTLATTGVTAGTYGSATQVPTLTVDAKGRATSVTLTTISGTLPGGSATGDLSGTYPAPTVARIRGTNVATTAPASGQVLKFNGTDWAPATDNTGAIGGSALTSTTTAITVTGGSNAGVNPATFTFNPANVNLGDLGSTLPLTKLAAGTAAGHNPRWNGSAWISAIDYGIQLLGVSNGEIGSMDVNGTTLSPVPLPGLMMQIETIAVATASSTATFTTNLSTPGRLYVYRNGVMVREGAGNDFTKSGNILTFNMQLAVGETVTVTTQK